VPDTRQLPLALRHATQYPGGGKGVAAVLGGHLPLHEYLAHPEAGLHELDEPHRASLHNHLAGLPHSAVWSALDRVATRARRASSAARRPHRVTSGPGFVVSFVPIVTPFPGRGSRASPRGNPLTASAGRQICERSAEEASAATSGRTASRPGAAARLPATLCREVSLYCLELVI
jgi:hypothetical protein